MAENKKRSAPSSGGGPADKKSKTKKQWTVPKKNPQAGMPQISSIQAGDAGIWATCDMNREAKCVGELRDLFQEYAEKLYGDEIGGSKAVRDEDEIDIEAEINAEVQSMQKPTEKPLFTNVKVDVQCVLFFKTRAPVDPVSFVKAICEDALATQRKKTRFVKRLTPMTVMGKATENGLEAAAKVALAPVFHSGAENLKFAIRTSIRNHNKPLNRAAVIKQVADLVGPTHKVDLGNPDELILIEVYQNICGISVVGPHFERLKRFNLMELYHPTTDAEKAKPGTAESQDGAVAAKALATTEDQTPASTEA